MLLRGMPSGLFDLLHTPQRGLTASQAGQAAVAHNLANAQTEGYTRRDLVLEGLHPLRGVDATGHRRAADRHLVSRLDGQTTSDAHARAREPWLFEIEAAVGDLSGNGLGATLDGLFGSFRTLAAAPDDPSARLETIRHAEDLAAQVRRAATRLDQLQTDANRRLGDEIPEINDRLAEVARLNRDIRVAEATGGDAGDLRDLRDRAVRDLAARAGTRALDDGRGGAIVLLGGMRLVQDDGAESLVLTADPVTGFSRVAIGGPTGSDVTSQIGGVAGAHVQLRDDEIPTRLAALDTWAWDLTTSLNARHAAGFGLDGAGGRNLFAPPASVAGAAASMAVDATVAQDPDALAAALDPAGVPGDGRNALELADLEDQDLALLGTATLSEAIASLQSQVGLAARQGRTTVEREAARLDQLTALRDSISGVDIQEQLLWMSRYQRAYEASARVISTLDDMLRTLVNL
jgi:flagellar hook-associated protein 1 FlgK